MQHVMASSIKAWMYASLVEVTLLVKKLCSSLECALKVGIFILFMKLVYIIHRRDKFYRASKIMSERALSNPKIEVIWNSVVEHIDGETKVNGITVKDMVTGKERSIPLKGVFLGIGHIPNTEPFEGKLDMDENG